MPRYKNILRPNYYKKNPTVTKMVVQKSQPLQLLAQTDITLAEFKIIDVYLGRIDSHNPGSRTVVFTKGEMESLLGVRRIRKEELEKRMGNLFQTVHIEDKNCPQRINMIALFEQSIAEPDWDGQWVVRMKCTSAAMKYIFNVERIGYVRYSLHTILNLTSRYSYFLFLYLENNKFRKTWETSVAELKQIIGCTEKAYEKYYRFNQLILSPVQKELKEKAGIYFTYTGIKHGRSTVKLKFEIIKLPKELEELKNSEEIRHESNILENNNYTYCNILDDSGSDDSKSDTYDQKKYANVKSAAQKRKSLADLKKQCEVIMQEDPFFVEIKEQFKYNELIEQNLEYIDCLDFIFQILYDILKSENETIRIRGVDMAALPVKARLLKLKPEEILYVAQKYNELEDIKNPEAFMITMLYGVVGMPVPKIKKKPKTSYDLDEWIASNTVISFND